MNKTIIAWSILLSALNFKAQLPNPGFEELTSEGKISYWGSIFLIPVYIDSTGSHTDSIIFDNQLYFSTNDAHSGLRALEMRNAYNYTSSQQIAGTANLMSDSVVSFAGTASISERPLYFSFYYKFLPAGNDTAYAYMEVFDYNGNSIGESSIELWAQKTNYTLVQKPISYHSTDSAAFISVRFSTSKSGNFATLGTRFLVDDVNMDINAGLYETDNSSVFVHCLPNPAEQELTIALAPEIENGIIFIYDLTGKLVHAVSFEENQQITIDVQTLPRGIYSLSVRTDTQAYHTLFAH